MVAPLLQTRPSEFESAEYLFYDALARSGRYDSASPDERLQSRAVLASTHQKISLWAKNCPENFGNRAALVGAEIARIEGRELDAQRLYEQAIRLARENGFTQSEGMANELAWRKSLRRSIQPSRAALGWVSRSAAPSWKITPGDSGPRRTMVPEPPFSSRFRRFGQKPRHRNPRKRNPRTQTLNAVQVQDIGNTIGSRHR
jgi:hypothetical protein